MEGKLCFLQVGKLRGLHLLEEVRRAKGQLASLKGPRIREGIAMGGYMTCNGDGRKFLEDYTSHFNIQCLCTNLISCIDKEMTHKQ